MPIIRQFGPKNGKAIPDATAATMIASMTPPQPPLLPLPYGPLLALFPVDGRNFDIDLLHDRKSR